MTLWLSPLLLRIDHIFNALFTSYIQVILLGTITVLIMRVSYLVAIRTSRSNR